MKVKWPREQLESPPDYDLCTKYRGVYVDIMRDNRNGTWSVLWNSRKWVKRGLPTRDSAMEWVEANIDDLSTGRFTQDS